MKAKFLEGSGGTLTLMLTPKTPEEFEQAGQYQRQIMRGLAAQVAVRCTKELTENLRAARVGK